MPVSCSHVVHHKAIKKVKHVDMNLQFTMCRLARGEVGLSYVPTNEMIADTLTKALHKEAFEWYMENDVCYSV